MRTLTLLRSSGDLNVSHHRSNLVESASPLEQEFPMEPNPNFYTCPSCGESLDPLMEVVLNMKDLSCVHRRRELTVREFIDALKAFQADPVNNPDPRDESYFETAEAYADVIRRARKGN